MTKQSSRRKNSSDTLPGGVRLHKIIAGTGEFSLRSAERAMEEGRVTVNGEPITKKGTRADPERDRIVVDGHLINVETVRRYLIMNKPKGVVTTRADEKGRKTVMDFLPKQYQNLYPVGRLDLMSEGLLILTNDGTLAQAVLAPKNRIQRVYQVKVRNIPDKKTLAKMVSGITLKGVRYNADSVTLTQSTQSNVWLRMALTKGKKHHIRKLCETLGHPVLKLKRVSIGPVTLGNLAPGETRHLPVEMVNRFLKMAGHKRKRN